MQVIKLDILKGCIGGNRHASDDVVLSAASHLFQVSNGQFVHCFVGFGLGSIIKDVLGSFLSFYFNRNKVTNGNVESSGTYKSKLGKEDGKKRGTGTLQLSLFAAQVLDLEHFSSS